MLKKLITILLLTIPFLGYSQKDSFQWNCHFQTTNVEQYNGRFKGDNIIGSKSFNDTGGVKNPNHALSYTSTLFLGAKYKMTEFYINPEIAGGSGLAGATGIAGFPNGETFRVGNPAPGAYLARAFLRQEFRLSKDYSIRKDDQNLIYSLVPKERIILTIGKLSLSDLYDQNISSHDPKTSFMNWSLMDNGVWDYSSNTRGYTYAMAVKIVKHNFILRSSTSLNSLWSNGPVTLKTLPTFKNYSDNHGETIELTVPIKKNWNNMFKILLFANHGFMGNYNEATNTLNQYNSEVTDHLVSKALDSTRGNTGPYYKKYGAVLGWEEILKGNSIFIRAGYNNGKYETWMFTEIDQSLSGGIIFNGKYWKRKNDKFKIGSALDGISRDHYNYIMNGGYGFIIGDGKGNYGKYNPKEIIIESQYILSLNDYVTLSLDYQFIKNPGYNTLRGPINIFGLRAHIEI